MCMYVYIAIYAYMETLGTRVNHVYHQNHGTTGTTENLGDPTHLVLCPSKVPLTFPWDEEQNRKTMNWFLLGVFVGLVVAPSAVVFGLLLMAWYENWQWKREQRKKVEAIP